MLRALCVILLLSAVLAKDKILVIYDTKTIQKTHSQYFQALIGTWHNLVVARLIFFS